MSHKWVNGLRINREGVVPQSLELVTCTILKIFWKIFWKVCIFILSPRHVRKKIEKSDLRPVLTGVQKCGPTPPYWYARLRPLSKVSKNFLFATSLGRISQRDLKFHLNPNLPDCHSSMASKCRAPTSSCEENMGNMGFFRIKIWDKYGTNMYFSHSIKMALGSPLLSRCHLYH